MTANFPPPLALTLRLAELIDRLPRADPRALERVRAIAERVTTEPWADLEARVQVWRQLHWLPLYLHFGKSRCWNSARVHAMPPEHLQALLESDLGVGGERSSLARASGERGESTAIASSSAIPNEKRYKRFSFGKASKSSSRGGTIDCMIATTTTKPIAADQEEKGTT